MPVSQDPGTVPVPCGPLLAFRFTKVNEKKCKKKSLTAWKPAKNAQAYNDALALGGRVHQSDWHASLVARRPNRRDQHAETMRHERTRGAASSCFETTRFALYLFVSIHLFTAPEPAGSP